MRYSNARMAFAQFVFAITDAMVSQLVDRFTHTPWSSLIQIAIDAQIKVEDRQRGAFTCSAGK